MIELPAFDAMALSLHHSPGVNALIIGSGISRSAGIPTGWEITVDLIRRLAALDGVAEVVDWELWYKDKYKKEPNYSEILDALAPTQAERRSILHAYIEAKESEDIRKPTKAHRAIAQLVLTGKVRVIITTNFDRLLENALRDLGVEPTVIASDDAINGATPLVHSACTVVKVHGDYLDARIKNTDDELMQYSPKMNLLLDQIFDSYGLVAVGWSGEWDAALRDAIRRAPSRRYPFYWAARGSVGKLAQELLEQRGGRIVEITDADSCFAKLEITLDALEKATRPHPISVEMAIATAKQLCRDDKYELEWAQFLYMEVCKIKSFLDGHYPKSAPTIETLNGIVSDFMKLTETLRRACIISGRWGTSRANKEIAKTIKLLCFSERDSSGYTAYSSLVKMASSICFYWHIAGLLYGEKWREIHKLVTTKIKNDGIDSTLLSVLPFVSYRHIDWKFLPGLENQTTPVSDYMFEIFTKEASDIFLTDEQSFSLFNHLELTLSLETVAEQVQSKSYIWPLVGRYIWQTRDSIITSELARITALDEADSFFSMGMMGGSKAVAMQVIEEAKRCYGEMGRYLWRR